MPVTPLHYSVAYLVSRASGGRLSLPALTVGAVAADLEIPVTWLLSLGAARRLVLHSVFGALVFGVPLTLLITGFVYPRLVRLIFSRGAAGVEEECRLPWRLASSSLLGVLSHIFIDSLHHEYNPLLWPFTSESVDALVLFNDWLYASIFMQALFSLLFAAILLYEAKVKGMNGLWGRLLVRQVHKIPSRRMEGTKLSTGT